MLAHCLPSQDHVEEKVNKLKVPDSIVCENLFIKSFRFYIEFDRFPFVSPNYILLYSQVAFNIS